jgi:hypothetical protein
VVVAPWQTNPESAGLAMSQDLVEIYVAIGQGEGTLVKSYLEAHGVPVMSTQEGAGAAYGINVGLMGEVHLFVAKRHVEKAKDLIKLMNSGTNDEIPNQDETP